MMMDPGPAAKRRWVTPRLTTEYTDATGIASKTVTHAEDTNSNNHANAISSTGPSS
jgi:hypothetical protein